MTNELLGLEGTTAKLPHPALDSNSSLELRPHHAPLSHEV